MKHFLRAFLIALVTITLSAQNNKATALALNTNAENTEKIGVFKFDSEIIDYGTLKQNADGNRSFTFKNIGNTPIIISKVKASCGCTVATKPNQPIMPGETAKIGIKYATNRIGAFSKSITIISNAKEAMKILRIKGTILKTNLETSKNLSSI